MHVAINESRPITRVLVPAPGERLSDRNNRALAQMTVAAAAEGVHVLGEGSRVVDVVFKPPSALTGNVQLVLLYGAHCQWNNQIVYPLNQ